MIDIEKGLKDLYVVKNETKNTTLKITIRKDGKYTLTFTDINHIITSSSFGNMLENAIMYIKAYREKVPVNYNSRTDYRKHYKRTKEYILIKNNY